MKHHEGKHHGKNDSTCGFSSNFKYALLINMILPKILTGSRSDQLSKKKERKHKIHLTTLCIVYSDPETLQLPRFPLPQLLCSHSRGVSTNGIQKGLSRVVTRFTLVTSKCKLCQSFLCRAIKHHLPQIQQCEVIKQFEDGVTRLMNG